MGWKRGWWLGEVAGGSRGAYGNADCLFLILLPGRALMWKKKRKKTFHTD